MPAETGETEEQVPVVWFDYRGAQEHSGLGRTFLWQRIASGELRAYKVGRKTRIRRADLDAFLSRRSAADGDE
ncbi:MAG: helix-turn-helix domain-containing protein [Actinomycetota bacterium]|nr:helix-turn-helix domain-containing protein [Actinomycetota bacterium]MDP9485458.1 helix-turn-helix domain-containing protein [Actinomycetota bacterium]